MEVAELKAAEKQLGIINGSNLAGSQFVSFTCWFFGILRVALTKSVSVTVFVASSNATLPGP